jgi:hypothetical protein
VPVDYNHHKSSSVNQMFPNRGMLDAVCLKSTVYGRHELVSLLSRRSAKHEPTVHERAY